MKNESVQHFIFCGLKHPKHEAKRSPLSFAEIRSKCSCTLLLHKFSSLAHEKFYVTSKKIEIYEYLTEDKSKLYCT
jgi:hypothetical protein